MSIVNFKNMYGIPQNNNFLFYFFLSSTVNVKAFVETTLFTQILKKHKHIIECLVQYCIKIFFTCYLLNSISILKNYDINKNLNFFIRIILKI